MERMPSASEMERYKQEMLRMYRLANPITKQAPPESVGQPEPPAPRGINPAPAPTAPILAEPIAEPMRPSEPVRPQTPPAPPTAPKPCPECAEDKCVEDECPTIETEPVMVSSSDANVTEDKEETLRVIPSPQQKEAESEKSDSLSQADTDFSTAPRYPEDFSEEPPFPEDAPPRRASDIPTEQGTGEPAASEEDDSLGISRTAYPGQVVSDTSAGPQMMDLDLTDIPYVNTPLPQEYLDQFSETGYIRVKLASSNQAMPVKGASIIISKAFDSQNHILHRETSDQSGLTPNLPLPAPSTASSTTPNGDGTARFASYDMLVTRDGYVPVIYRSIPVFSGVVTVQPVQMVPQTAAPEGQRVMEYEAPAPNNL